MSEKISIEDFQKIDIRIGKILTAEDFPTARKPAYKLTIDFGDAIGIKRSSAQITALYTKEELIGRHILAVINFPPMQIADFISQVLVLGVVTESGEVVLLTPEMNAVPGQRIL
jgi:tRNA-binding protein